MAYYLERPGEEIFRVGLSQWPAFVNLAKAYNWKSKGTTLPESARVPDMDWSGTYLSMDHAIVDAEDANNMADAIERALVHWPREDQFKTTELSVKTNLWSPPNSYQKSAIQYFLERSDERRLEDMIVYLRQGTFELC
jgi:hypothetical protein